ncbi:probable cysteine desulfurase [Mangifera indica]|uniref:probable cysteine desulfurase n=1 Tax=Mangifera indica TaxID=29780 RepID=UPI001CF94ECC|nr:probable cysteine desulfurase [Mangifera indica]
MKLEQPNLGETGKAKGSWLRYFGKARGSRKHRKSHTKTSSPSSSSQKKNEFFEMELPKGNASSEERVAWLQSQFIGGDAEFDSPFGRRKLTYADHTASGRSLRYIEDYIVNNVLPFYGNTHSEDSHVGQQTTKLLQEASRYIKRCLGGGREDALLFCGSGATAAIKKLQDVMGIAVTPIMRERLIKCLRDKERWIVFIGPHEHHSNILSWRHSLAQVIEISVDDEGLINIEELKVQLELHKNSNRPILGSFSACSNVNGICSDTRSIARLLHQYGGFACFDFATSGSYVEIDMRSGEIDGYDGVFLSGHKFVGGPGSAGILLMSKVLYQLSSFPPSTCGGGTVNYVNGFNEKDTLYLDDIEGRENAGTPPIIQTIRAALAFWVKEYIGYEVMKAQQDIYLQRALERLLPNQNIKVLGNTTAKRQALFSFLVYSTSYSSREAMQNVIRDKPLHGSFVATLLNDLFGIQARGGCDCAGPYGHILLDLDKTQSLKIRSVVQKGYFGLKPGWTRISFPFYMSNEEFEFILSSLEFIALYGQRFLPLYRFNLKTGNWCFNEAQKSLITDKGNSNHKSQFKPLAKAIQDIGMPKEYLYSADVKHLGKIYIYSSYFDAAKNVANLLPKNPPRRSLPKDIDPDILFFRI